MNTVDRVKTICKERGIPISKLEKDLGFANGYLGQLKKGVLPDDRLYKISAYLGLSPLVLSERNEDKDMQTLMYIKNITPDVFKIQLQCIVALYMCQHENDEYFRKEILQC